MFKKVLIANRGEIACRVIRTTRKLGYRTVAVYSQADAQAPHVSLADEAICIGPAPAAESYLRIDAILSAARATGADAIHPGYGFLSENADFAQACADHQIVFIGPPPEAIRIMGDKAGAKARMIEAKVPTAPGYLGQDQSDLALASAAERLGYPLLVKAVSGGGGRGMRLVHQADELIPALISARREAQSAFGDGTLMLEKLILNGRHIEIQVFADAAGDAVYIGERDCTAQRRRQKVIEEAPSPIISAEMRANMGRDAVAAALAVGYQGAGTIEFIVDEQLNYYFLEMNTRLQVEHPVTEMIAGFDLVEWQLRIAAGHPLPVKQADIQLTGHAIEARLYAEDPYAGFAPQTGHIHWWRPTHALYDGVRIDDGIQEGGDISPFYDAMVAKLIVHGRDREDAIRRLIATLDDTPLVGLRNNARFLRDLVDHPSFRAAQMTTSLIDHWAEQQAPILQRPTMPRETLFVAAAILSQSRGQPLLRSGSATQFEIQLKADDQDYLLLAESLADGALSLSLRPDNESVTIRLLKQPPPFQSGEIRYSINGITKRILAVWVNTALHLTVDAATFVCQEASPWPTQDNTQDPSLIRAPVAGTIAQVLVQPGDTVENGQQLLSIEAMKMEMWLCAQAAGTVKALHSAAGQQVQAQTILVELELSDLTEKEAP